MIRPLCKCHGVPMHIGSRSAGRIYWNCAIKNEARARVWECENRARHLAFHSMRNARHRGDRGSWMNVLRITKISEVIDNGT
mgnify:FL=1